MQSLVTDPPGLLWEEIQRDRGSQRRNADDQKSQPPGADPKFGAI